ncbi:MAG: DDE-type integrase/transposase/recombinase [Bacteroidetes bacterium]|nr:DDE-type integrase/transposase/recombinase [Bacteroidota bacterium]
MVNLIENMKIDRPEQVWVSDITYIRTQNGFLYLSIITDAYSKKVMGFNLSHRLEARGAVAALRKGAEPAGAPILSSRRFTTDRGIQYCCENLGEVLQNEGIAIRGGRNHANEMPLKSINRTFKEQLGMGATLKTTNRQWQS